jgi:hypothetical protein
LPKGEGVGRHDDGQVVIAQLLDHELHLSGFWRPRLLRVVHGPRVDQDLQTIGQQPLHDRKPDPLAAAYTGDHRDPRTSVIPLTSIEHGRVRTLPLPA